MIIKTDSMSAPASAARASACAGHSLSQVNAWAQQPLPCARMRLQQGFSMVSAVFLLVILSTLGAAMVTFSTVQHTTAAMDVQGARAYQAARAGLEWGLHRALISASCAAGPMSFVPAAATLNSFTVSVTCTTVAAANVTPAFNIRYLTVTACNQPAASGHCPGTGGTVDYVQRVVQATF